MPCGCRKFRPVTVMNGFSGSFCINGGIEKNALITTAVLEKTVKMMVPLQ